MTSIPFDGPISHNDYLLVEPVALDVHTAGLAIKGNSGAAGRAGDLDVYKSAKGAYERVFHLPSHRAQIIDAGPPTRLEDYSWNDWKGFPVNTDNLDMVSLSYAWAARNEYTWDSTENTFVKDSVVLSDFAVVNYFLKHVAEENLESAALLDKDFLAARGLSAIIEQIQPFVGEHLMFLPGYRGYDQRQSDHVVVIGAVNDPNDPTWMAGNQKRVIVFELIEKESSPTALIHKVIIIPTELMPSREYSSRPTLDFDQLGFEWYAGCFGWEKTYNELRDEMIVEPEGDWLACVAILRSPALMWVEAHYAAELRFEPEDIALKSYEDALKEANVPFTVKLASFSRDSLESDNLKFVLATNTGEHWEGRFTAKPMMKTMVSGLTVISREFHVEFDTSELPLPWDLISEITLYIIRQDKFERAEVVWNFGPALK